MIRSRLRRVRGFVALSARRLYVRGTRTATRRTAASIAGVAVAIALLVIASGLAVGLATQTTIYGEDVDYWITPEGGGETSALVATGGPQFGEAHTTTAQIESLDGVNYATPVLSTVRFTEGPNESANVLFVGIIPRENMQTVSGVSTTGLSAGEIETPPDRDWSGEVVLSASAASQLGIAGDSHESIHTDGATFDTITIDEASTGPDLPIAVVQLTDLQQLTGGAEIDTADQFLVSTTDSAVRTDLETVHDQSSVNTRADLMVTEIIDTDAALAIGVGAFLITFVIGTLFIVMTAGLELTTDAATMATLSAIGVSGRSQMALAGVQTLLVTLIGGIVGAGFGLGSLHGINAVVSRAVLPVPVASTHPAIAVYGVLAAVVIGVITLPYIRYLLGRIGPDEVMR